MWQIISTFIGIFVLGIGEIIFAKIVLNQNIEINKIKAIIVFIITTIMCTTIYLQFTGITKTLFIYLIHLFEFKILFKLSYFKSIFLTFIYMILLIIPDIIQLLIITSIKGTTKNFWYEEYAGSILGNFTICILFVLITIILKKYLRKLINAEISNNLKIVILSFLTLVCITLFFYIFTKEFRIDGNALPYLMVIIVLITILFILIKQTMDNNRLTREYDKLLEFMTTFENEIEKQRILRHEIKNEFRTIKAKICDKQENKEIIEYIDEIVNDKYEVNKEKYAKFGYLPANGIKGLCYFKTQEAEDKDIKVSINISKKVKESTIYSLSLKEQRDFGRILGVFLDNAIEASAESVGKQLGVEAYVNTEKEFKLIISNTYNNKIDKNKIGKENFSTKGKKRGHGLLLVKQLVDKNDIFETKTEIQDNLYIQTIEIKK